MAVRITLEQMQALYEFELSIIEGSESSSKGLFTGIAYKALTTYLKGRINYCIERIDQYGPKTEIDLSKDA